MGAWPAGRPPKRTRALPRRATCSPPIGSAPAAGWSPPSASCSPRSGASPRAPSTRASAREATAPWPSTAACEDIVFAELERLHEEGLEFTAISEERGEVRFGAANSGATVVIDPIDGSLNARRTLPSLSLSIAVASGPHDGRRRVRLRLRLRRRRGVLRAPRATAPRSNERAAAGRGPGLRARGGRASRRPSRSALIPVLDAPRGQGLPDARRRARSRSRSATWPAAASTRCSPAAPAARSTRRPAS